ncbi:hypothetical protein LTR84_007600 [Exophiala bonariae]|uniref:HCNGP-like protein n=1 Tax=Exophiala bonariae TaxID=1690606 RepID=A0AAV9NKM6_9EURO|nr:hypothetical protein LTR84_007600 [Exophiala bonariae]
MSGLVGYNSSSDEDDAVEQPVPSTATSSAKIVSSSSTHSTNGHGHDHGHHAPLLNSDPQGNSEVEVGPLVGPAMPTTTDTQLEQDSSRDQLDSLSQRDTVRYLTQPSHPMTSIPPSPPGSPDPALNTKFKRFLELKAKGVHFNEDLGKKSTFRNPSFLATLMDRAGLESDDQYKTSLPPSIWDPLDFPPHAFREELLRSQHALREQQQAVKKSQSAAGKRSIEFTSGGTSGHNSRDSTPGLPSKRKRG